MSVQAVTPNVTANGDIHFFPDPEPVKRELNDKQHDRLAAIDGASPHARVIGWYIAQKGPGGPLIELPSGTRIWIDRAGRGREPR